MSVQHQRRRCTVQTSGCPECHPMAVWTVWLLRTRRHMALPLD